MEILHTVKSGKVNVIPLTNLKYVTRHTQTVEGVRHEGWAVSGEYEDKEHRYLILFSPEEAKDFHEKLGKMLPRLQDDELTFITEETHDE